MPENPRARLSLTERATCLAVLLLLAGLGVQWGLQRGAQRERAAANDDFYPVWAATARYNHPLWVRDTDSALGRLNQRPKQLSLKDLARLHGHLCDGLVVSWVELNAALRPLFSAGVVDRTDLRVVSKNGPCWVDAAGWLTGARVNHGTLVLDNTIGDGFVVQRISTGRTVRVSLRPGVFPADLAELEQSIRARRAAGESITPQEVDRFEQLAASFSRRLLGVSPQEVVNLEEMLGFEWPAQSLNPLAGRSDIINRDLERATTKPEEKNP